MNYLAERSHTRIALVTFMVTGLLLGAGHTSWGMVVMIFGSLFDGLAQFITE